LPQVELFRATVPILKALLGDAKVPELGNLRLSADEEIAPRFLLEQAIADLRQDPDSTFWLAPRLMVVEQQIVGMGGFKGLPHQGAIEIGYGVIPSQQRQGFATQAVAFLVEEAFSAKEVQTVLAHTIPQNRASQRVLKKNGFIREGSLFDPEDGELWIWHRTETP
jgi:RimJ/RimL family protein N-acetyltransferase